MFTEITNICIEGRNTRENNTDFTFLHWGTPDQQIVGFSDLSHLMVLFLETRPLMCYLPSMKMKGVCYWCYLTLILLGRGSDQKTQQLATVQAGISFWGQHIKSFQEHLSRIVKNSCSLGYAIMLLFSNLRHESCFFKVLSFTSGHWQWWK
jgi:hypothetical protein